MFERRSCTVLVMLLSAACFSLPAQQASEAKGGGHASAAPDYVFYRHIFRFALFLDANQPETRDAAQPARGLHKYFSERIGTSEDENALILSRAKAWKKDIDPIEAESRDLINSIHAQTPGGILMPGQAPPLVPPHLIELQQEKDAITRRHMAALRHDLGETRASLIDDQLHKATHLSYSQARLKPSPNVH